MIPGRQNSETGAESISRGSARDVLSGCTAGGVVVRAARLNQRPFR